MPTATVDQIDDIDGDEVFAQVTLADGSNFSLCRNDIDWDPLPYDEQSLADALEELERAPVLHAALRERILDLEDTLDSAFTQATDLATEVGDLQLRDGVKTTYGGSATEHLRKELGKFIDSLRDELGRASMQAHRTTRSRREDLADSAIWKERRDEAVGLLGLVK